MGQFHSQFHNSIEIESGKPNIKARQVVSALERLILTQDPKLSNAEYVDPGKDLIVYGDVVEIRGPLELPGRAVPIPGRRRACGGQEQCGESRRNGARDLR